MTLPKNTMAEMTQIRPGVSCIFAVKAKDGQIDKVKEALEKTKSDMDTTVAYLPLDKEMLEAPTSMYGVITPF